MKGQAHGKAIVLGEHAVVHGQPALAAAISAQVTLEWERSEGSSSLSLESAGTSISTRLHDGSRLGEALLGLVRCLGAPTVGWRLRGECHIPLGSGLGSSAAIAAASARAVCAGLGLVRSEQELFEAVQASEKVFHGNPSGIDAAVALQGGVLRFSRDRGATPLALSLPRLVVVHSGEPKDTKVAVERFSQKLRDGGDEARQRIVRIGQLVELGISALARESLLELGQAMNENQEHLSWFEVSTSNLERICRIARGSGAHGAKLTGAGCGGVAIVLTNPGDDAPVEALRRAGFQVISS
jgi:mevalonate kinase